MIQKTFDWRELGATPQEAMQVINNLKLVRKATAAEQKHGVVAIFKKG